MKFHYLCLFVFIYLANDSNGQNFGLSNLSNQILNYNNSTNSNDGIAGTIRNTTGSILQSFEGPRDRVIEFIKPAVKSDLSRNLSNFLNSIWSRVQESNSSIIQNHRVRSLIVIPINTGLERLKKITAAEDSSELDHTNFEVVNLNYPAEEYEEVAAETKDKVIFLNENDLQKLEKQRTHNLKKRNVRDEGFVEKVDEKQQNFLIILVPNNQENSTEFAEKIHQINTELINKQQNFLNEPERQFVKRDNEDSAKEDKINNKESNLFIIVPEKVEHLGNLAEETKLNNHQLNKRETDLNKRPKRFMDRFTTTVVERDSRRGDEQFLPNRVNMMFDDFQRERMRECFAKAVCESNCSPSSYGGERNSFNRFFDRIEPYRLNHRDFNYYLEARRLGQQYYSRDRFSDCSVCFRYRCPHNSNHLMNRFSRINEFY